MKKPVHGVLWCSQLLKKNSGGSSREWTMHVRVFSENQNCAWTSSCGCEDFPKWRVSVSAWSPWILNFSESASTELSANKAFLCAPTSSIKSVSELRISLCCPAYVILPSLMTSMGSTIGRNSTWWVTQVRALVSSTVIMYLNHSESECASTALKGSSSK